MFGAPTRTDEEFERDRTAFHEHLDACRRCREQCFNLCPVGAVLLRKAAIGDEEQGDGVGQA